MCGRFTLSTEMDEITRFFHIEDQEFKEITKRYNIAPTQLIPGVVNTSKGRTLREFRWGLIPFWAKDAKIGYKMINARAETLQKKPAFRSLIERHRIIIPSDGFYEWKKDGSEKQPYRIQMQDGKVYGFAGLYDTWENPEGERVWSCTIITTTPNKVTEPIHNRMPVILDEHGVDMWLDPGTNDKDILQSLLVPYPAEEMTAFPVSKSVNYVKNQGADLIVEAPINSK